MEKTIRKTLSEYAVEIEKDVQYEGLSEQDLVNKWTSKVLSLSNEFRKENAKLTFKELYLETMLAIAKPGSDSKLFSAIPTGFTDLDRILMGLPKGELIVIGARPAMGKTAFMVSIMANLIESKRPMAYFSIENSAQQILMRLLSVFMEMPAFLIASKENTPSQIDEILFRTKAIGEANVTVEDTCFSIDDIISQVDYLVKEKKIELVFIDYLQLIKVKSRRENNREADISKVCRELKALARKYNIAVVVSSQLSRAVETRGGDKRPQLSDLRESGAIEQDADKVLFIHRPEYYNITEDEYGTDTRGMAEIIIAKNREGVVDSAKLNFIGNCTKFQDIDLVALKKQQYGAEYFKEIRKDEFKESIDKIVRGSKMNDIDEDHPF
ncbi:MAG: AAA family ATPase [Bacteroidetes bacterium]|nr:AAA family ATPase [Bacteroidota bacterium]